MTKYHNSKVIENYPNKSGKRALILIEVSIYEDYDLIGFCADNQIDFNEIRKYNFVTAEITPNGFSIPSNFKGKRYYQTIEKIIKIVNTKNGYDDDSINDLLDSMYMLEDLDVYKFTDDPTLLN